MGADTDDRTGNGGYGHCQSGRDFRRIFALPPSGSAGFSAAPAVITIGVPPAGCAVLAYNYFDVDMIEAPHGRGPAMASGIKRSLPDRVVFSYQGDGDLAAIGMAESFHAANRGENITVIFINNAVYGMTGGQMAPTTMLNQRTTTSPTGRKQTLDGYPVKVCEIFSQIISEQC